MPYFHVDWDGVRHATLEWRKGDRVPLCSYAGEVSVVQDLGPVTCIECLAFAGSEREQQMAFVQQAMLDSLSVYVGTKLDADEVNALIQRELKRMGLDDDFSLESLEVNS